MVCEICEEEILKSYAQVIGGIGYMCPPENPDCKLDPDWMKKASRRFEQR